MGRTPVMRTEVSAKVDGCDGAQRRSDQPRRGSGLRSATTARSVRHMRYGRWIAGTTVRLRRRRAVGGRWTLRGQNRLRTRAAMKTMRRAHVASHDSAADEHGLEILRPDRPVHPRHPAGCDERDEWSTGSRSTSPASARAGGQGRRDRRARLGQHGGGHRSRARLALRGGRPATRLCGWASAGTSSMAAYEIMTCWPHVTRTRAAVDYADPRVGVRRRDARPDPGRRTWHRHARPAVSCPTAQTVEWSGATCGSAVTSSRSRAGSSSCRSRRAVLPRSRRRPWPGSRSGASAISVTWGWGCRRSSASDYFPPNRVEAEKRLKREYADTVAMFGAGAARADGPRGHRAPRGWPPPRGVRPARSCNAVSWPLPPCPATVPVTGTRVTSSAAGRHVPSRPCSRSEASAPCCSASSPAGWPASGSTLAVRRRTGWPWAVALGLFVWSLVVLGLITLLPANGAPGIVSAEGRLDYCSWDIGGPAPDGFWIFAGGQRLLNTLVFVPSGVAAGPGGRALAAGRLAARARRVRAARGVLRPDRADPARAGPAGPGLRRHRHDRQHTGAAIGVLLGVVLALVLRPWRTSGGQAAERRMRSSASSS